MQQWQFNPHEGDKAVSVVGQDDVVFYIDDLNPEVVAKIVEIYNQNNDVEAISTYLKDEERCTDDEREFIVEQIVNYIKLSNGEVPQQQNDTPPQQEQADQKTPDVVLTPETPKQQDDAPPFDANDPLKNAPPPIITPGSKRQQRRTVSTDKKESTEDFIKSLQEKIEIAKILDSAEVLEVPTGLTKASRDLLTAFQKEQEDLIAKYLDLVKKM